MLPCILDGRSNCLDRLSPKKSNFFLVFREWRIVSGLSRRAFNGAFASALACSVLSPAWATQNRDTRVVLLLSGVITDGGWSQLAYNGLTELQSRHGFKTAYAENISLAQMDQ